MKTLSERMKSLNVSMETFSLLFVLSFGASVLSLTNGSLRPLPQQTMNIDIDFCSLQFVYAQGEFVINIRSREVN